ncbi:MAG: hypothetical protein WD992_01690 [Candidatus Levyibacteriota bacterium]
MPRQRNNGEVVLKGRDFDKLKLLYQSAIALKIYEGTLIWSRFSAFMVVNTIIFTLIGLLLNNPWSIYIPIASIVGIVLTFLWFLSTKRGFEAIDYWTHSIGEIEGKILENEKIPSPYIRGEEYFKQNREVEFIFSGSKSSKVLQRGCFTRSLSFLNTRMTAYITILLIIVIYILIIVSYFLGWLPAISPRSNQTRQLF